MKNKKTLYILIPLVTSIWGLVIWKLIDYQPSGEDCSQYILTETEEIATDTARYELRFGYRDPFLRSSLRSVSAGSSKKRKKANNIKQIESTKVAATTKPVNLVYRGEVSGHRCKLGLVELEGDKVLVSEHSMVGAYTILSIETDSLILSYFDKRFTYGKE